MRPMHCEIANTMDCMRSTISGRMPSGPEILIDEIQRNVTLIFLLDRRLVFYSVPRVIPFSYGRYGGRRP